MANELQYTTTEGQRWDTVALEVYGKADLQNKLIEANPAVPLYDIFPAGVVLNVPVLATVEVQTDAELLPPWKQ